MTADQVIFGVFLALGALVFAHFTAQARFRATEACAEQLQSEQESDVEVESPPGDAPATGAAAAPLNGGRGANN